MFKKSVLVTTPTHSLRMKNAEAVCIWNKQTKDISWCLVCNFVYFLYDKISINGHLV